TGCAGLGAGVPFLFDAGVAPDEQGGQPGREEQPHDHEPGGVDVEPGYQAPEAGGAAESVDLPRQQAQGLDHADDEADHYGSPGDSQVVVDLADRVEERPAVGQVHEQPVR